MTEKATCDVCGKSMDLADTGRPRLYCSARCKERRKRRRAKEEARAEAAALAASVDPSGPLLCHVCGRAPATVGSPDPLICGYCAASVAA